MKAVVYKKENGLVLEDISRPTLDADQVLVKVAATGFCGSDHSLVESEHTPDGLILGHEVSGVVVEIGAEVKGVEKGTKVMIRPTFCGQCRECQMGKPQLCTVNRKTLGIGGGGFQGGFAEYFKVVPQMLIPIPEGVNSTNAALAETYATTLHAVNCSKKTDGSALIIGGGAIGLALVSVLKILGFAPIIVSEPVASKREIAQQLGAEITIDPLKEELGQRVFAETGGVGPETVFECSGIPGMVQTSLNLISRGGTLCIVSVMFQDISISPAILTFKEVTLTAAYGNTHEENKQCLQWMKSGQLDSAPLVTDTISLEELPKVYKERIRTGKAIKVMLQIGEAF